MSDEMLYAKLGLSIATDHSFPPKIHDEAMQVYNLLYPLLLAPFYGSASAPAAFHAAHVFGAFVMASAALPYLIARQVLPRTLSLAAGLLAVLVPWMAYSTLLMTEVVGYPAFLWATLALLRALHAPSWRGDLVALAGLTLAVFARTQFLLLALVFPLALLLHEAGYEAATASPGTRLHGLRVGARKAVTGHPVLLCAYGVGAVYLAAAAVAGSATRVLGTYGVAAQGTYFPDGLGPPPPRRSTRSAWPSGSSRSSSVAPGCSRVRCDRTIARSTRSRRSARSRCVAHLRDDVVRPSLHERGDGRPVPLLRRAAPRRRDAGRLAATARTLARGPGHDRLLRRNGPLARLLRPSADSGQKFSRSLPERNAC